MADRVGARSLADWLRSWSDAELAALVASRPDLVVPVPADLGVLATRVADRVHVARALDGLDAFALRVLDAVLLLDAPVDPADVAALVGADVTGALALLTERALVWDAPLLRPVAGAPAAVPRPGGLGRPAGQLLRRVDRGLLAGMLAAGGLPLTSDRDEAATRLVRAIALPTDEAELSVLRAVDAGGGIGTVSGALTPAAADDPSPVRRLLARGLLVPVDADTVELPREVGAALRDALLPAVAAEPPALELAAARGDIDGAGALEATELVRLTSRLLATLGADPPVERKSGGLGARDLRALARAVGTTEQTIAMITEIAYAAGLLGRTTAVDAAFAPTHDADGWERGELPARWARLARAWLVAPGVVAAVGSRDDRDAVVTALSQQSYRPVARELRTALLAELAAAPAGQVPTRESVLARLSWRTPRRVGAYAPLLDPTRTEAALLGVVVGGALTSFGRALAAGEAPSRAADDPAATALAKALPPVVDHVLLQADHTAVAPGPLPPELAHDMALVADVESPGSATVYRFTPESVRRALDAGWSGSDVAAFLARVGRGDVPQGLDYLVADTARRHGLLRAGAAAAYLRCDDEQLLTQAVSDPRCDGLRLRRVAPTVVVSALEPAALVEGLRAAGYAPVGEGADGSVAVLGRPPVRAARGVAPGFPAVRAGDADRAVASLRAGDRAARSGVRSATAGITSTLTLLDDAARTGGAVLLGYVNAQGQDSRRIVEPQSVAGGLLTAYDHKTQERRSFALHRITEVATVDPGDTVA